MGIVVTILIVIASIIALVLIAALFAKKSYSLYREIVINRPVPEVFNYIKHLRNQDHFSKWVMTDPNMKKTYTGTDGQVGFVYAWDGNKKAGQGEQEILQIREGQHLDVEVRFIRPFAGIARTPFTTEAVSANETKLKWGMSSAMKYPMNVMLLFMDMDKLLGKDLETSLGNLKGILEKR
jgi:uncharacterized protein YndB with AHSA1/START domain